MKLAKLETLRLAEFPNLLWLRLHTDQGLVGLGETSFSAESVEAYLHEFVAPRVLGRDPLEIERLSRELVGYLGFRGSGVETRAASAFDIALWDLYGKYSSTALSAARRSEPRFDPRLQHLRRLSLHPRRAPADERELGSRRRRGPLRGPRRVPAPRGRARALPPRAGHHGHEDLAVRLLRGGSDGLYISATGPGQGARAVPKIRKAVGDRMDIMVEFHSLWRLPARSASRARWPSSTPTGTRTHPHGQPRAAQAVRAAFEGAGMRLRDPRRTLELQGPARDRGRRHHHVRPRLVRRHHRSAPHRRARRRVAAPGRAARLHRAAGVRSLGAFLDPCAQRPGAGIRARVLHRLVP